MDAIPFATAPTRAPLTTRVTALVRDLRDLAHDHLELAALEAQRAAMGLAKLLSAAVVVSVLVASAWIALVAAGIVWATEAGVGWGAALATAALVNAALAAGIAWWIKSQAGDLLFAATLRQLRATAADAKDATEEAGS